MKKKTTEWMRTILAVLVMGSVLYLFYHSIFVLSLLLPYVIVYRRYRKKELEEVRKHLLGIQFRDLLDSLAASLRAGLSVENALSECRKDLTVMYGEDSPICKELAIMNHQIQVGVSAEKVFQDLAERSRVEDIDTFASVFSIAKRTGGDMVEIIRKTADDIADKLDTKQEIDVLVSAKRLEANIMTLIPAGIILYINLTSDGLLDPMYGNLKGILIMTICLLVYGAAFFLGRRIMRIEV